MSDWFPSLNALRAFESVSRHLSYRKAADELNVTPAAVKQLVSKLEDTLGEPLFERDGRGLCLTRAGANGSADLTIAFKQIASAVGRMRANKRNRGLVVTVDPSFAAAWLVPRMEEFKSKYPSTEVLIDSSMQLVDLNSGFANIGIRFGVKDHGDLVAHRLFDETLCALCSPSIAKGPPRISQLEDLETATLMRWDLSRFDWAVNTRKWNYWKNWLLNVDAAHIKPGKGLVFSEYNLAVQAAIAGHGFVLGSQPVLRSIIERGLLVDPFSTSALTDIGYDVVTTQEALSNPQVKSFIDWILGESV